MINGTLFKRELKANFKVFIIIFAVLILYTTIITSMFDPELGSVLAQFTQVMPELMNAFGMANPGTTLIEFLSSYLYGFLYLIFPLIFEMIVANQLVARYVDRGSMAYLLATPSSRFKIIFTQVSVLCGGLALLIGGLTLIQIIVAQFMFPGELDVRILLNMNSGLYILHLAISGICFFGSCISNEMKRAYSIGAGIPILFFLIQMLSNVSEKLESLKYFTIFTLYLASEMAAGGTNAILPMMILLIIAVVLYGLGCLLFIKRDLPL